MHEAFWGFVFLLVLAFILAVMSWAFMLALIIAGVITLVLLPWIVLGFIQGWKSARRDDSDNE